MTTPAASLRALHVCLCAYSKEKQRKNDCVCMKGKNQKVCVGLKKQKTETAWATLLSQAEC